MHALGAGRGGGGVAGAAPAQCGLVQLVEDAGLRERRARNNQTLRLCHGPQGQTMLDESDTHKTTRRRDRVEGKP